jgi:uncharacterized protein (TIGR03085 family)
MRIVAQSERAGLCAELERVGPAAPTLCEGWTTADLAAHLVARERRPDHSLGLLVKALAGHTDRVRLAIKQRPYEQLVAAVRKGPPGPLRLPAIDAVTNTVEMFVHHEDVRRAQPGWEPRDLDPATLAVLWRSLLRGARLLGRRVPTGLTLRRTAAAGEPVETVVLKRAEPSVLVTGDPAELCLFVSGRGAVARVEFSGAPDAVARVKAARIGI